MMPSFTDRLREYQESRQTLLCVGLDPDPSRLPPHLIEDLGVERAVYEFCRTIAEATERYACAFKFNLAFFEALGLEGYRILEKLARELHGRAILIADAKRGDIGNTARMYAEAIYDRLGADACTVAPYMGADSVLPFLEHPGRAAFVLGRTSNPGSSDFQQLDVGGRPLFQAVAEKVEEWNRTSRGEAGLVVGATAPEALAALRTLCPGLPFLVPGVGAQGGDEGAVVAAAHTERGPVIVNSSRSILYASSGRDFAAAAEAAARDLAASLRPR